jgi:hypothetical protein
MQKIMVQVADRNWTLSALHLACALARSMDAEIALVKMVPVQHISWLGTEFGYQNLTVGDHDELIAYQATAEDYGVPLHTEMFQYMTLPDAIADAAEYFGAQVVFATLPKSALPYWRRFQLWNLRRRLARQHRQFYTLDRPRDTSATDWTPSILVRAAEKRP